MQDAAFAGTNGTCTNPEQGPCDSQSDLAANADKLAAVVDALYHSHANTKVVILANSMGAGITRGYLSLHAEQAAAEVAGVATIEGAHQGAQLALIDNGLQSALLPRGPGGLLAYFLLAAEVKQVPLLQFDVLRPAFSELKPRSSWYRSTNVVDQPTATPCLPGPCLKYPKNVNYYNAYGDIHLAVNVNQLFYHVATIQGPTIGDGMFAPGTDLATDLPLLGGARFRPVNAQGQVILNSGYHEHQWRMEDTFTVDANVFPAFSFVDPSLINSLRTASKVWHGGLGMDGHAHEVMVEDAVSGSGALPLNCAIKAAVDRDSDVTTSCN